jgi:hypothetical protein
VQPIRIKQLKINANFFIFKDLILIKYKIRLFK